MKKKQLDSIKHYFYLMVLTIAEGAQAIMVLLGWHVVLNKFRSSQNYGTVFTSGLWDSLGFHLWFIMLFFWSYKAGYISLPKKKVS